MRGLLLLLVLIGVWGNLFCAGSIQDLVCAGEIDKVRDALLGDANLVYSIDSQGRTPLYCALFDIPEWYTVFHESMIQRQMVNLLVEYSAGVHETGATAGEPIDYVWNCTDGDRYDKEIGEQLLKAIAEEVYEESD